MGILNKLFGKDQKPTNLIISSHLPARRIFDDLAVHSDLVDLIWVADGERKNYSPKASQYSYLAGDTGVRFTVTFSGAEEPSLISTKLLINTSANFSTIERPPYYPTYAGLTPEQRGLYWRVLENPYDSAHDIGYIFILYYGLERHLLEGNFEKAFRVIEKLRDIHSNKSFQNYSGCALVLTAIMHRRPDLALEFYNSIDKEYELNFSDNLYMLCIASFGMPFTPKELMKMARTFEFSNIKYIKEYPDEFENALACIIQEKTGKRFIDISDYINKAEYRRIKYGNINAYANTSLKDASVPVPLLSECFKFKKAMNDFLEVAHEETKKVISIKRRDGTLKEPSGPQKPIRIVSFDMEKEKELISEYRNAEANAMDKHFALIHLQDFYYKYRDINSVYLEKCIMLCNEDLALLPEIQRCYIDEETNSIMQLASVYGKGETEKRMSEVGFFNGRIPAFERLTIIYEKAKDFNSAIRVCQQAILYYRNISMVDMSDEFWERKKKLLSKVNM
jgi:hypothetical protein